MESKIVKLGIISDTHGKHQEVVAPECDVLIHCGDCTNDPGQASLRIFLTWLESQKATHKILVAGNHDWAFEKWPNPAKEMVKRIAPSVTYLEDSGCEILGIKFWGSPVTPEFYNWAFNRKRGEDIKRHWDMIPASTDVLVTHGPPKGFHDYNKYDKFHCGCEDLLNSVMEIRPRIHCFGHIHSGYGKSELGDVTLINASVVNEQYKVVNQPIYHDLAT